MSLHFDALHNQLTTRQQRDDLLEVFVGNVPFFCTEFELADLFRPFGKVTRVMIKYSEDRHKSLGYAFVKFESRQHVLKAVRCIHGCFWKGKHLRVESNDQRQKYMEPDTKYQIHLWISSRFQVSNPIYFFLFKMNQFFHLIQANNLVLPTEEMIYQFFESFGEIMEVKIKDYKIKPSVFGPQQDGYGFFTFKNEVSYQTVLSQRTFMFQGILFQCTASKKGYHSELRRAVSH